MRASISFTYRGNSGCSTRRIFRDFGSVNNELNDYKCLVNLLKHESTYS